MMINQYASGQEDPCRRKCQMCRAVPGSIFASIVLEGYECIEKYGRLFQGCRCPCMISTGCQSEVPIGECGRLLGVFSSQIS